MIVIRHMAIHLDGQKIIVGYIGYDFYFNKNHDTIKVMKNANLYESWVAFKLLDSIKITAEVIKHYLVSGKQN